jgi:hypothetical protein
VCNAGPLPTSCPGPDVCPRFRSVFCKTDLIAKCVKEVAGCPCCWRCVAPYPPALPPTPPPPPKSCPGKDVCLRHPPPTMCMDGFTHQCVEKVAGCPCCWTCAPAPSPPPLPPSLPPPPETCTGVVCPNPRVNPIRCIRGFVPQCVANATDCPCCPCCWRCVAAPSPPPLPPSPPPPPKSCTGVVCPRANPLFCLDGFVPQCVESAADCPCCPCCWKCVVAPSPPALPPSSPPPPKSCPGKDVCPRVLSFMCRTDLIAQCVEEVAGCPCCWRCVAPYGDASAPALPPSSQPPSKSCPGTDECPRVPDNTICPPGETMQCVEKVAGCPCCFGCAPYPPELAPSPLPPMKGCPGIDVCLRIPITCVIGKKLRCVEKVAGCPCCYECDLPPPSPPPLPPSPPPPPKSCPPRDKCLRPTVLCRIGSIRTCVNPAGCECCVQCVEAPFPPPKSNTPPPRRPASSPPLRNSVASA